jgi:hypothetical protein
MKNLNAWIGICVLATAMSALGGDEGKNPVAPARPGPFDGGTWELQGGAGEFCSFSTTSAKRQTINYQLEDVRLGLMIDSPRLGGCLRGNDEVMLEVFGGPTTKGPSGFLAGGSLLWRYNFVQPDAKLIPYIQIGGGALGNNIYEGLGQREIGEGFEFVLQGGLGLRYMINDRWSVAAEAGYRHISNAGLAARNEGLNSIGGLMELSYFFH